MWNPDIEDFSLGVILPPPQRSLKTSYALFLFLWARWHCSRDNTVTMRQTQGTFWDD